MSAIFSPCRTWRYTLSRNLDLSLREPTEEPCPSCGDAYFTCLDPALCLNEREPRTVAFIGLNPSTADETKDDPTIRRCRGFANRWGYERLVMLNVFAYRATDPKRLGGLDFSSAVGPENDRHIAREAKAADLVVCAWGVHAARWQRGHALSLALASSGIALHHLGLTKDGHPRHPLYMRGDLKPTLWTFG